MGLESLRRFSDLLAQGYLQALKESSEASLLLPRFLPDGRWLRAETKGGKIKIWAGKQLVQERERAAPAEDPVLSMRVYWDNVALDLSSGIVDLLEIVPEPFPLVGKAVLFTPSWATILPFDEDFTGASI